MKYKVLILIILVFFTSCEKAGDSIGSVLKFYGDAKDDIGRSIAITDDGYLICGQVTDITRTNGNFISSYIKRMGIIKTDFNGNSVWEKSFGGRQPGSGSKIIELNDGSIIATGYVTDTVSLETDILVVKLKSDGSDPVEKIYNIGGNQSGTDILQTVEGFIILATTDAARTPVTESTGNNAGKKDVLLVRLNKNLGLAAAPVPWGFPNDDYGVAIKNDPAGGFIITGTTDRSEEPVVQDKNNYFLLRVNALANVLEYSIIGGIEDEYAADLEVDDDGYIIAGTIGSDAENQSINVLKIPFDIFSEPLFNKQINISGSCSVNAMSRYKNYSFVLAGQAGSPTSADMLIFMIDSGGDQVGGKEMLTGGTGVQSAGDVITDSDGDVIATGKSIYESSSMISLLKFKF
jgi:hypothetical protein